MLYLRGKIWWTRFNYRGKRYRKSTGSEYKNEAEFMARQIRARIESAMLKPDDPYGWAAARWRFMNHRERQAITFARFGGRCVYCNTEVHIPLGRDKKDNATRAVLDHKIPVSGGGPDELGNIVLACNACNAKKYDRASPDDNGGRDHDKQPDHSAEGSRDIGRSLDGAGSETDPGSVPASGEDRTLP